MISPESITDPVLGTLSFRTAGYEIDLTAGGFPITLVVDPDDSDIEQLLATARRTVLEFGATIPLARRHASDKYLSLKNDRVHGGDQPISRAEFENRLVPQTLIVQLQSEIGIFFDDGDMFGGHRIVVWINPDGSFDDVYMCG